jgi:nucleotide-binding universal stress UspA family protein
MKFTKILVPVKGLPVEDQTIRVACQAARVDKAQVVILHVIEIRRNLPLETEDTPEIQNGEAILEHAFKVAKEAGVQPETELLQARVVGPVLFDEATNRSVDLIIMGVPYRQPLDEFYLGTAVRYLLKNATCPVWLCRQAATASKVQIDVKRNPSG